MGYAPARFRTGRVPFMSYDLFLFFEPSIEADDFLQHFARRKHFTAEGLEVAYHNPDTGVDFHFRGSPPAGDPEGRKIASGHFNINYCRPSFFGLEAEVELSAFDARFKPQIVDPQSADGSVMKPYSSESFLRAWNAGNIFGTAAVRKRPSYTLAAASLQRAWQWNYQRAERQSRSDLHYVPGIFPIDARGTAALAVVWPEGNPILMPWVDYVFVGRMDGETRVLSLATWAEVLDVLRPQDIDLSADPLDVWYPDPEVPVPLPIARWIAGLPAYDDSTVHGLGFWAVVDTEVAAAGSK